MKKKKPPLACTSNHPDVSHFGRVWPILFLTLQVLCSFTLNCFFSFLGPTLMKYALEFLESALRLKQRRFSPEFRKDKNNALGDDDNELRTDCKKEHCRHFFIEFFL